MSFLTCFLNNYKKYKFLKKNLKIKCLNCDYNLTNNCWLENKLCSRTILSKKEYNELQGTYKTIKNNYLIMNFYCFKLKIKL
jgi:hypothetical protein